MKKINIKNLLIIVLGFSLLAVSIGFIFLSSKFEMVKNKGQEFEVKFSNVKQINSIKGGSKSPIGKIDIIDDGKILDFSFDLYNPKDEIDYEVTVKNVGNIDAEINKLLMSPDYEGDFKKTIDPVSIIISDISGKVIEPGSETVVKFSVLYDASSTGKATKVKGKIGIIAST